MTMSQRYLPYFVFWRAHRFGSHISYFFSHNFSFKIHFISQGVAKMYNAFYAEDFHWTICLIQDLYKIHAKTKSRELAEYFEKFAVFTEILFKIMIIAFVSCTMTFFLYPFYMYFIKGELMPMMPLYLPFVNETCIYWRHCLFLWIVDSKCAFFFPFL